MSGDAISRARALEILSRRLGPAVPPDIIATVLDEVPPLATPEGEDERHYAPGSTLSHSLDRAATPEGLTAWSVYVHPDKRFVSLSDGESGDTLLPLPEGWRDIAKVERFAEWVGAIAEQRPSPPRKQKS